jgi:hypothetical protein
VVEGATGLRVDSERKQRALARLVSARSNGSAQGRLRGANGASSVGDQRASVHNFVIGYLFRVKAENAAPRAYAGSIP